MNSVVAESAVGCQSLGGKRGGKDESSADAGVVKGEASLASVGESLNEEEVEERSGKTSIEPPRFEG